MTDLTTPAEKLGGVNNESMAHAIAKSGGHDGYVVDGTDLSPNFPELDETGVARFDAVGPSGLSMTFEGGEAFVFGWLCRDRQTSVDLPASTTSTVYVGFDLSASIASGESPADSENVILGLEGAFDTIDPRVPIAEVTTDGSGVVSSDDAVRPLGRAEATAPWASDYEHPDTLPGPLTLEGGFGEHLKLDRPGVGLWDITPTTRNGGGLLFTRNNDNPYFEMTDSRELITDDNDHFVKADEGIRMVISSGEPAEYDIWFEVD